MTFGPAEADMVEGAGGSLCLEGMEARLQVLYRSLVIQDGVEVGS